MRILKQAHQFSRDLRLNHTLDFTNIVHLHAQLLSLALVLPKRHPPLSCSVPVFILGVHGKLDHLVHLSPFGSYSAGLIVLGAVCDVDGKELVDS